MPACQLLSPLKWGDFRFRVGLAPLSTRVIVKLMANYPKTDLEAFAGACGFELEPQLEALREIYADVDARNAANTKDLDLPCHRGCDACCHESVFLTTLEFLGAWDWIQSNLSPEVMDDIIDKGLALYQENKTLIDAFNHPPPEGESDHFSLAQELKFRWQPIERFPKLYRQRQHPHHFEPELVQYLVRSHAHHL